MFQQPLRLFKPSSLNVLTALLQQETRLVSIAANQKEKWDLMSAICLERHPKITPPMNELQTKFQQMLHEIEFENSMKSDHELRKEMDKNQEELIKKGKFEGEIDASMKQTAVDFEDACEEELEAFTFAPRITEDDKKNNTTSLNRRLDRNLLLLLEQKLGPDSYWLPPQGIRKDGETMRQAAERVLKEACGDGLNVKFYGNAPCGFYKFKYPKHMRESGAVGAKVFYFLAKHLDGNVTENAKYQWLDRMECEEIVPEAVTKSLSQFLIAEEGPSGSELSK